MIAAAVFPSFCAAALKDALSLCAGTLVPSLFLYIAASNLLSSCGAAAWAADTAVGRAVSRITGLSGAGTAAFLLGLAAGFPAGAIFLSDMAERGVISGREAERLLPFANNCSPAFVIGAVGSLFGSVRFGVFLFLVQTAASFAGAAVFAADRGGRPVGRTCAPFPDLVSAFPKAVRDSVLSMLAICGFVAVFSVPCRALGGLGVAGAFMSGVLEIGNGCSAARMAGSRAAAAFAVGFSGLSVFFQVADTASRGGIRTVYWLPAKLYSGIVCAAAAAAFDFFNLL